MYVVKNIYNKYFNVCNVTMFYNVLTCCFTTIIKNLTHQKLFDLFYIN